jgi:hypothetical protein
MTQDDIIDMAQEAGFVEYELDDGTTNAFDIRYQRFANLVAAHKAEVITAEAYRCGYKDGIKAAAIVCENVDKSTHPADLAAAIRARGNT